jgi:predicted acylesterase/phospholipase RssA/CRP-like cAMP-binding protein
MTLPLGASPTPPSWHLARTPLFGGVDARVLARFDDAHYVRLEGGDTLCRQGDPGDALWVVARGRLHVLVETDAGHARLVDTVGRGALVGEMALLLDEPRTATVVAARDSELIRIARDEFQRLLDDHPTVAQGVARLLGERLKRTTRRETRRSDRATIAVLPLTPDVDGRACAERIIAGFDARDDEICLVTPDMVDRQRADAGGDDEVLPRWMSDLEDRFRYVVYVNDPDRSAWAVRCLRGSDVMLLAARAGGDPALSAVEHVLSQTKAHKTALELLLLHPSADVPIANTARWLKGRHVARHHHVRMDIRDDYARVGRFASGRGVGVVLSGGGARGLAHLGVLRALTELGVAIDSIGGASMGAIVGALCASGLDADAAAARLRDEYVEHRDYDYTLPIVALSSAAGSVRRMKRLFGDRGVEDLPLRYFCMSTNLSRAEPVVIERGPLWRAVRTSSSLPGLLPPIADGGDLFVDGGLLNNLPADIMRQSGAGIVIGVDVTSGVDLRTSEEGQAAMSGWSAMWRRMVSGRESFPSVVDIMSRTALVGCIRDASRMRAQCDVYIAPPVSPYGMNDFRAMDRLVAAGYEAAVTALETRTDVPRRVVNT